MVYRREVYVLYSKITACSVRSIARHNPCENVEFYVPRQVIVSQMKHRAPPLNGISYCDVNFVTLTALQL